MVYATFFLKKGKLIKEIIIFERTSKGVATCINWEKKGGGGAFKLYIVNISKGRFQ